MSQAHYDVVILGESLGSRIAGLLLAKSGLKVLTFGAEEDSLPQWIHVPLHLERILEKLDGQSCFSAAAHFQLLTERSRIDFHGSSVLDEELRREFPSDYENLCAFFDRLKDLGQLIEKALWESRGLPLMGLASRGRFLIKRFRHRLFGSRFKTPAHEILCKGISQNAFDTVSALFSGLSMSPFDRLSMAECALLWRSVANTRGVCVASLDELLHRRYSQFHGAVEPLKRLSSVQSKGGNLLTFNLDNGTTCTATYCIVGNTRARDFFPILTSRKIPPPNEIQRFITTPLGYKVSPLLAGNIITSKTTPMRLTLRGEAGELRASIEATPSAKMIEDIKRTLTDLFPFASFDMIPLSPPPDEKAETGKTSISSHFPGSKGDLRIGKNIYFCIGSSLFPTLGSVGEILTGSSSASDIISRTRKGK